MIRLLTAAPSDIRKLETIGQWMFKGLDCACVKVRRSAYFMENVMTSMTALMQKVYNKLKSVRFQ